MNILWLAPYAFSPPNSGGRIRMYNLISRLIQRGHRVDFWYAGDRTPLDSFPQWEGLRVRQYDGTLRETAWEKIRMVFGTATEQAARPLDAAMAADLRALESSAYDVVMLEHSYMAGYLPHLAGRFPIVITEQNVEHALLEQLAESFPLRRTRIRYRLEAFKLRRMERAACASADLVVAMSELEKKTIEQLAPASRVAVHSNGVDLRYFTWSEPAREVQENLLFLGTLCYPPNVDAAKWISDEIHPLIQDKRPQCHTNIVGSMATPSVRALESETLSVHVGVPDVRPFMASADVFLMPLRMGAGTRLKALDALASGLPIVSTSLAVEGLDLVEGDHVLLGETAAQLADHCLTLLSDADLRSHMSAAGRTLVENRYDWDNIAESLEQSLYSVSGAQPALLSLRAGAVSSSCPNLL